MNNAIYNPNNKPVEGLPIIYGFNNGGSTGWYSAQLIAEDGTPLGSHICSHEGFMRGDLGINEGSRSDRHEHFQKHYPNGYKMDFITFGDVDKHDGLQKAFILNKKIKDEDKDESQNAKVSITVSDD